MVDSTITLFSLALGLGMLHAFDADHLLTITGLSAQKNQWQQVTRYSAHWVIGHSFSLIIIGISVFVLGVSFNKEFSEYAEYIVALILAVIGLRLLINAKNNYLHSVQLSNGKKVSSHKALAIGSLHGIAGTASILAIIPVTKIDEPYLALSYILVFSIGVFCSMMIFGGLLRHSVTRLILYAPRSVIAIQISAGLFAFAFAISVVYTLSS